MRRPLRVGPSRHLRTSGRKNRIIACACGTTAPNRKNAGGEDPFAFRRWRRSLRNEGRGVRDSLRKGQVRFRKQQNRRDPCDYSTRQATSRRRRTRPVFHKGQKPFRLATDRGLPPTSLSRSGRPICRLRLRGRTNSPGRERLGIARRIVRAFAWLLRSFFGRKTNPEGRATATDPVSPGEAGIAKFGDRTVSRYFAAAICCARFLHRATFS